MVRVWWYPPERDWRDVALVVETGEPDALGVGSEKREFLLSELLRNSLAGGAIGPKDVPDVAEMLRALANDVEQGRKRLVRCPDCAALEPDDEDDDCVGCNGAGWLATPEGTAWRWEDG